MARKIKEVAGEQKIKPTLLSKIKWIKLMTKYQLKKKKESQDIGMSLVRLPVNVS